MNQNEEYKLAQRSFVNFMLPVGATEWSVYWQAWQDRATIARMQKGGAQTEQKPAETRTDTGLGGGAQNNQIAAFEAWAETAPLLTPFASWKAGYQAALESKEVQGLREQNKQLISLVEEMSDHDTYETEYDGRMYSICHGCSAQDNQEHRGNCVYVRARTALAAMKEKP